MTNEETKIMNEALNKAINAGMWGLKLVSQKDVDMVVAAEREKTIHYGILFSRGFLQAFFGAQKHERGSFGGETYCKHCKDENANKTDFCWQTHGVNMVLADDPVEYVGAFLKTQKNGIVP